MPGSQTFALCACFRFLEWNARAKPALQHLGSKIDSGRIVYYAITVFFFSSFKTVFCRMEGSEKNIREKFRFRHIAIRTSLAKQLFTFFFLFAGACRFRFGFSSFAFGMKWNDRSVTLNDWRGQFFGDASCVCVWVGKFETATDFTNFRFDSGHQKTRTSTKRSIF